MKKKYDDLAQIGLGLMVVYIACILAMVTCGSLIIQQTEKLAQQAQHTIHDANKESSNKEGSSSRVWSDGICYCNSFGPNRIRGIVTRLTRKRRA